VLHRAHEEHRSEAEHRRHQEADRDARRAGQASERRGGEPPVAGEEEGRPLAVSLVLLAEESPAVPLLDAGEDVVEEHHEEERDPRHGPAPGQEDPEAEQREGDVLRVPDDPVEAPRDEARSADLRRVDLKRPDEEDEQSGHREDRPGPSEREDREDEVGQPGGVRVPGESLDLEHRPVEEPRERQEHPDRLQDHEGGEDPDQEPADPSQRRTLFRHALLPDSGSYSLGSSLGIRPALNICMRMRAYEVPDLLTTVSAALKAAGEPSRLRILKVLEDGELCICHMVELLGVSQPTVSRHLAVLRRAGLVEERKDGRWSWFRVAAAAPFLRRILGAIGGCGEDDPTVAEDRRRAEEFRKTPVESFCTTKGSN
jgi:DNA-binding transcriptional ArsR family regulator